MNTQTGPLLTAIGQIGYEPTGDIFIIIQKEPKFMTICKGNGALVGLLNKCLELKELKQEKITIDVVDEWKEMNMLDKTFGSYYDNGMKLVEYICEYTPLTELFNSWTSKLHMLQASKIKELITVAVTNFQIILRTRDICPLVWSGIWRTAENLNGIIYCYTDLSNGTERRDWVSIVAFYLDAEDLLNGWFSIMAVKAHYDAHNYYKRMKEAHKTCKVITQANKRCTRAVTYPDTICTQHFRWRVLKSSKRLTRIFENSVIAGKKIYNVII